MVPAMTRPMIHQRRPRIRPADMISPSRVAGSRRRCERYHKEGPGQVKAAGRIHELRLCKLLCITEFSANVGENEMIRMFDLIALAAAFAFPGAAAAADLSPQALARGRAAAARAARGRDLAGRNAAGRRDARAGQRHRIAGRGPCRRGGAAPGRHRRRCRHRHRFDAGDDDGAGRTSPMRASPRSSISSGAPAGSSCWMRAGTAGAASARRRRFPMPTSPRSTGWRQAPSGAAGRKALVPGFMAGMAAFHGRFGRLPFRTFVRARDLVCGAWRAGDAVARRLFRHGAADPRHQPRRPRLRAEAGRALRAAWPRRDAPRGRQRTAPASCIAAPGRGIMSTRFAPAAAQPRWRTWPLMRRAGASRSACPCRAATLFGPDAANANGCAILMALNMLDHRPQAGALLGRSGRVPRHGAGASRRVLRPLCAGDGGIRAARLGIGGSCAARLTPAYGAAAAARSNSLAPASGEAAGGPSQRLGGRDRPLGQCRRARPFEQHPALGRYRHDRRRRAGADAGRHLPMACSRGSRRATGCRATWRR